MAKVSTLVRKVMGFGLVAGVFVWLVVRGDLDEGVLASALAKPGWLALAMALWVGHSALTVVRWQILLGVQGISLSFPAAFRLTWIAHVLNTLLPGGVAGDVVKAAMVVPGRPEIVPAAIVTSVVDRIVGLLTLVLGAIVLLPVVWPYASSSAATALSGDPRFGTVAIIVLAAGVVMALGLFATASGRAVRLFARVAPEPAPAAARPGLLHRLRLALHTSLVALVSHARDRRRFMRALGVSVIAQIPLLASLFVLAKALEVSGIPPLVEALLLSLGLIANGLPILPGGLGQAEVALEWLYGLVGANQGAEIALLFHLLSALYALLGAVVLVTGIGRPGARAPS